jgi:hypothetical protein
MSRAQVAALEVFGDHRVRTSPLVPTVEPTGLGHCPHLVVVWRGGGMPPVPEGWALQTRLRRPGERSEQTLIYRPASAR